MCPQDEHQAKSPAHDPHPIYHVCLCGDVQSERKGNIQIGTKKNKILRFIEVAVVGTMSCCVK